MKIFEKYVFGKLDEENNIVYFTPYRGGLKSTRTRRGITTECVITSPSEADMNAAGWYRVVNVAEDGTDYINDNILYHYTGAVIEEPMPEDEPIPEDETSADGE